MEFTPSDCRVRVTADPIRPDVLLDEMSDPTAGAVVLFLGTARDHSPGRSGITHLEYESFPGEVEKCLERLMGQAQGRWDIRRAVVEHRVGRVEVGQISVAVVVSAAHRAAAWDAGRFLIEQLKTQAPIWKQENWPGGSEWIEGA